MVYEIIGWVGTIAILLAYLFVSTNKISSNSKPYQLLNLFGAIGLIINSYVHNAYPLVGLNVVWSLIAVYALYKLFKP